MKFETGQTSSNNFQQVATTHNMVCKCSQHVEPNNGCVLLANNVASVCTGLNSSVLITQGTALGWTGLASDDGPVLP